MKPEEIENCGPSRDTINAFLASKDTEQSSLSGEQSAKLVKALMHIEMCYHGYGQSNLCHQLWHKLQPMTRFDSDQYDADIATFFAEANRLLQGPKP